MTSHAGRIWLGQGVRVCRKQNIIYFFEPTVVRISGGLHWGPPPAVRINPCYAAHAGLHEGCWVALVPRRLPDKRPENSLMELIA